MALIAIDPAKAEPMPADSGQFIQGLKAVMGGQPPAPAPAPPAAPASLAPAPAPAPVAPAPPVPPAPANPVAPAPAPTTPPTEPAKPSLAFKPEDLESLMATDWRPSSASQWKTVKQKIRDLEAELAKRPANDQIATVTKERDELRQQLHRVSLASDPAFIKEYEVKETALLGVAKQAGGDKSAQAEIIARMPASEARDAMLDELTADMTPGRAARLAGTISMLDTLRADKEAKLKEAPAISAELNAKRQAEQRQNQEALVNGLKTRLGEWAENLKSPELASDQEFVATVTHNFNGQLTPEESHDIAIQSALLPRILSALLEASKKLTETEAELTKYKAAIPNPGSGPGPSLAPSSEPDYGKDLQEGKTTLGAVLAAGLRKQGVMR